MSGYSAGMIDGWIQTFTGKKFRPLDARAEDVDVRDIAHALALKCRFNGHCREFYSVAEHSVRVSRVMLAQGNQMGMWGLMHDAAEAYLADLGGPIKKAFHVHHAGKVETFEAAEDRLLAVIGEALGFGMIDYEKVREADLTLLVTEARDLLGAPPESWDMPQRALTAKIVPMTSAEAEGAFLEQYRALAAR